MSEDQAEQEAAEETVPESEVAEIEKDRERRLDPDNRPDNAEINNSDAELPTVQEFADANAQDDGGEVEGSAGTADPSEAFKDVEVSDEEKAEIEEARAERLDPDNRPDNAEVDNTGKKFVDGSLVDDD